MINQSRGEHGTGKKGTLRDAGIRETQRGSWIKGNITEYSAISIFIYLIFMQNDVIKFLHIVSVMPHWSCWLTEIDFAISVRRSSWYTCLYWKKIFPVLV